MDGDLGGKRTLLFGSANFAQNGTLSNDIHFFMNQERLYVTMITVMRILAKHRDIAQNPCFWRIKSAKLR